MKRTPLIESRAFLVAVAVLCASAAAACSAAGDAVRERAAQLSAMQKGR